MKYLSLDIEATGLNEDCLIIEFGVIPFDTETQKIEEELAFHHYVKCPSFEELTPKLDQWVKTHNEGLIRKAHESGLPLSDFKTSLQTYLESPAVKQYFGKDKIVLFGKSMNAIDLPFLNRDLGWDFMRKYFHHRQLDFSAACLALIDLKLLPPGMDSGTNLMQYLKMGIVSHTALEDARNTAIMYFKILEKIKSNEK